MGGMSIIHFLLFGVIALALIAAPIAAIVAVIVIANRKPKP